MPYKETLRKEFEEKFAFDLCCTERYDCMGHDDVIKNIQNWFLSKIPTIIEEEKKRWKEEAVKKIDALEFHHYDGYNERMEVIVNLIKKL